MKQGIRILNLCAPAAAELIDFATCSRTQHVQAAPEEYVAASLVQHAHKCSCLQAYSKARVALAAFCLRQEG